MRAPARFFGDGRPTITSGRSLRDAGRKRAALLRQCYAEDGNRHGFFTLAS
jgi:hypothetical protein